MADGSQSSSSRGLLVGAWRVEQYDDRPTSDEPWRPSYGPDVDGLIIYDESGWLSVNVSGEGRFDSYFGRFEVVEAVADGDDVVGTLSHEIVGTSMPELLSLDQSRPFRLRGGELLLGDDVTWRRVCKRL